MGWLVYRGFMFCSALGVAAQGMLAGWA